MLVLLLVLVLVLLVLLLVLITAIGSKEEDCRLPGARSEKHSAGQLQRKTMGEKCSKLHREAFQWNECNAEIKMPY